MRISSQKKCIIFLKIVHNRLYKKLNNDLSETHFAFQMDERIDTKRCVDVNKGVHQI